MDVLSEPLEFDWDSGNTEKNELKHGVMNKEAEEVFVNRPFLLFEDERHSEREKRYQAMGVTDSGRLLFVSFTVRQKKVRVISVRPMDKKERRMYEKAEKA